MSNRKLLLLFILGTLVALACSLPVLSFNSAVSTQTLILESDNSTSEVGHPSASSPIFKEDFENTGSVADLFTLDGSRWHGMQLQPEDNIIKITDERTHSGSGAINFIAQPYSGLQASKADIYIGELDFSSTDEVWTEIWIFLEGSKDTTNLFLWDLEATKTCFLFQCQSPGRRLYFSGPNGEWLKSDLGKWYRGKDFRETKGEEIAFPKDQWVRVRVYLSLSVQHDGIMRVWQDNHLILDAEGITLPTEKSVYDRWEVGITANGNQLNSISLFLDDIKMWDQNPGW